MSKSKLWQADTAASLHPLVEQYTIGKDAAYDEKLLGYDIVGTKAHLAMLASIGIVTKKEQKDIHDALTRLHTLWLAGQVSVEPNYEDSHSLIEAYLVEKLGDMGKKIHTGRSRNDQALVMLRLYMKEQLKHNILALDGLEKSLAIKIDEYGMTAMPGYTHMQKAMPTTVGMWLGAYQSAFNDSKKYLQETLAIIDQNPLGSAAGFGVSLKIDRELTTKELGFKSVQENPMYCGLSRGWFELMVLQSFNMAVALCGTFANDMLLFTTQEFNFFRLPDSFVTGSSIMPHKKNYDVFEIMRGHANSFNGYITQVHGAYTAIGSGFQRDLQLTKASLVDGCEDAHATLTMLSATIEHLEVHDEKLKSAITDEMKSVEKINQLVVQGMPFRDAYKKVKERL